MLYQLNNIQYKQKSIQISHTFSIFQNRNYNKQSGKQHQISKPATTVSILAQKEILSNK